jgi:hypothetical protein
VNFDLNFTVTEGFDFTAAGGFAKIFGYFSGQTGVGVSRKNCKFVHATTVSALSRDTL